MTQISLSTTKSSPTPLIDEVADTSPETIVENGYGDFLLVDTTGAQVEKSVFEKAFVDMNRYLPQVHQKPLENRLEVVNKCVKQIDPHLQVVFIPRALYELYYLLGAYQEELDLTSKDTIGCPTLRHNQCKTSKQEHCWHTYTLSSWDDHNLDPEVVELAYRLNQLIVKDLGVAGCGLTESQCKSKGTEIVHRFGKMNQERERLHQGGVLEKDAYAPLISNMKKGVIIDPKNLEKAISLECGKGAQNAIILYRGSTYKQEPLYVTQDQSVHPYCASFGISLFAGYMKDINSCAGARMFYDSQTVRSYALAIPLQNAWQDAFHIPPVNTLCGLNGSGEKFHARAKCLPASTLIAGFAGKQDEEVRGLLVTSLTSEELQKKLNTYQDKRIEFQPAFGRKIGST